jgi:hypothetical protein
LRTNVVLSKIKLSLLDGGSETLADELELMINEADRAIIDVMARSDYRHHRMVMRNPSDTSAIAELERAMAEVVDAYPTLEEDLGRVRDRMKTVGARTGARELERNAHVLDLIRLSLEVFVRRYPTPMVYERIARERDDVPDDGDPIFVDFYNTRIQVLSQLRLRVS